MTSRPLIPGYPLLGRLWCRQPRVGPGGRIGSREQFHEGGSDQERVSRDPGVLQLLTRCRCGLRTTPRGLRCGPGTISGRCPRSMLKAHTCRGQALRVGVWESPRSCVWPDSRLLLVPSVRGPWPQKSSGWGTPSGVSPPPEPVPRGLACRLWGALAPTQCDFPLLARHPEARSTGPL